MDRHIQMLRGAVGQTWVLIFAQQVFDWLNYFPNPESNYES